MTGICSGRVVIVTGAARGLGRAHALAFAAEGASVVVNDYGLDLHGEVPTDASGAPADETGVVGSEGNGADATAAQQVVHEITAGGGTAVANHDDVADWAGAQRLVGTAIDTFGRLDVLVNNAGFLRDRMLANLSEEEWDAVIRVHLKGHFAPLRHAATYWRAEAKAGRQPDARVINTSSGAGLQGSVGQGN
ncbi:MAG: hypothetical protein QOG80_2639, partial [Pseudonocardiales bacterium]|nr:hypothetical protein [Pseudonocardiales bacterium]